MDNTIIYKQINKKMHNKFISFVIFFTDSWFDLYLIAEVSIKMRANLQSVQLERMM